MNRKQRKRSVWTSVWLEQMDGPRPRWAWEVGYDKETPNLSPADEVSLDGGFTASKGEAESAAKSRLQQYIIFGQ